MKSISIENVHNECLIKKILDILREDPDISTVDKLEKIDPSEEVKSLFKNFLAFSEIFETFKECDTDINEESLIKAYEEAIKKRKEEIKEAVNKIV